MRLRPKSARIARAHGTAKIHKLPPFRPIIDTIGTTHYEVGKYITHLLNPLSVKHHTSKDFREAADRIKSVLHLLEQGYVIAPLHVNSLFTNVPLKETIDVIIDRIYEGS